MLNQIWPIFIIISFSYAIFSGNLEALNASIFQSTSDAINLSVTLLGTICLWTGIMQIASKTTMMDKLTKILQPVINLLFPEMKKNKQIKKEISMNVIANIFGLGNAATPLGLKAMQSMQEVNTKKDTLSNSMIIFIVLNTASIEIIPTTVVAIRSSLGSDNPTGIIPQVLIATICAAVARTYSSKNISKNNKK